LQSCSSYAFPTRFKWKQLFSFQTFWRNLAKTILSKRLILSTFCPHPHPKKKSRSLFRSFWCAVFKQTRTRFTNYTVAVLLALECWNIIIIIRISTMCFHIRFRHVHMVKNNSTNERLDSTVVLYIHDISVVKYALYTNKTIIQFIYRVYHEG